MWQDREAAVVWDEIDTLLASLPDLNGFRDLLKEPLTRVSQRLGAEAAYNRPWPLLPMIVYEAISGYFEHAIPASAAIQLFMAAAEVFDDIEDADAAGSLSVKYGYAIATNAATTLLILAERAICRLKEKGVADYVIVSIMAEVNSFYGVACAGQHLDLSLTTVSEDTYLRVASMKSASTPECACRIGALLATANQELIGLFTLFGHNIGIASQIANDIQGIIQGNDIINHKITLPVIYALTHTDIEAHNQLELAFGKRRESTLGPTQIRDLLFKSGAIHYATIKMEFYKQIALDTFPEMEKAGVNVERLKLFLE